MDLEDTIRQAIMKSKSLVRAIVVLRKAGLPEDVLRVLEVAAEAEADLASERGKVRSGAKNKFPNEKLQAAEFLIGDGMPYSQIASKLGMSKAHVGYIAARLKKGLTFAPSGGATAQGSKVEKDG